MLGIYVHIPFCKKKCKYCDFYSIENKNLVSEYVKTVKENIEKIDVILEKNNIGNLANKEKVDTIYFGGGTPSYIDSIYITQILEKIRKKFDVQKDAEITIEVNPGTVNKEKLENYFNAGINRLSIGLQSTNNSILKAIGRIHTFEEFKETYTLARNVGFKNINVDLMLALPFQTIDDLINSTYEVIKLNPEHISIYSLILEDNTPLKKEVENKIIFLPSEDDERKMYHKIVEILEKNGFLQYEISNFSKEGFNSKHNLNCWKQHEYLSFGAASHSYFNNTRFSYIANVKKYIDFFSEQMYNKIVEIHEIQNFESKMREYIILRLRTRYGVNFKEFKNEFGIDFLNYFNKEILKLQTEDLIKINSENITLSKKGLDFANIVFEEFI